MSIMMIKIECYEHFDRYTILLSFMICDESQFLQQNFNVQPVNNNN